MLAAAPVGLGNNGGDVSVAVCSSSEDGHGASAPSPNAYNKSLVDRVINKK